MRTTLKTLMMSAALLGTAGFAGAQVKNAELLDADASIVANASKITNLQTLVTAVETAGLAETLMGEGPYTVFAPVDSAFGELPEGQVQELLKPENRETLTNILGTHVVSGLYDAAELETTMLGAEDGIATPVEMVDDGQITFETLNNNKIVVEKVGDNIYVSTPTGERQQIIAADIQNGNGVVHAIDGVLIPRM